MCKKKKKKVSLLQAENVAVEVQHHFLNSIELVCLVLCCSLPSTFSLRPYAVGLAVLSNLKHTRYSIDHSLSTIFDVVRTFSSSNPNRAAFFILRLERFVCRYWRSDLSPRKGVDPFSLLTPSIVSAPLGFRCDNLLSTPLPPLRLAMRDVVWFHVYTAVRRRSSSVICGVVPPL